MASLRFVALLTCAIGLKGADLDGVWSARTAYPDGHVNETYYTLHENGSELSGTVRFAWGDIAISNGQTEGDRFHFELRIGDPPRITTVEGTVEGETLKIKSSPAGRPPTETTATRANPDVLKSFAKLPTPALKKLPSNKLAKLPPMGWNSWNKFATHIDDKAIREIADAIDRNGMRAAGYLYINIDDSWQGERDAQGKIRPNKKFPDMKALADYIHKKNLLIGIYSSPGPKTCGGYEGSYGHELQDAETYADWGFDYLKYDWCSAGQIYRDSDMQAVYQKMSEALQGQPRPIVLSLCQYGRAEVWKWGPDISANSWRTTDDIQDTWTSMSSIGFRQGTLAAYAGPGHWNDPDMLEIGNGGMTDDEYRVHLSLWAMAAAPLIAGNDVRNMSKRTQEILTNKEVIEVDRDPLGKAGVPSSKDGDREIWTRPLARGAVAVALFNRGDGPAKMSLKWSSVLKTQKRMTVRDLWRHEFVKIAGPDETWSTEVPKHGVVMLRIAAY